jgi:predicted CoA-binding protein
VAPPADLVQLFRRSVDVPRHLDELLAARPRMVWMQLGIHHQEVAEQLARAGIHVIQNRCLQVALQPRAR